jgi:hypothetical protein
LKVTAPPEELSPPQAARTMRAAPAAAIHRWKPAAPDIA